MDFRIDPETHDLVIGDSGDLEFVTGYERVVQQCRIRLRFFRGEWIYDGLEGMPYYEQVLAVKPLQLAVLVRAVTQALLGVPGMRSVTEVLLDFDPATRNARVTFQALAQGLEGPFSFDQTFRIG